MIFIQRRNPGLAAAQVSYAMASTKIPVLFSAGIFRPSCNHINIDELPMTAFSTSSDNSAIEAAVFRRLLQHLDSHKEVQNIDLMILADFCRNCLAKWYVAAASENGIVMDYEQARELIYGMPYSEWKDLYQAEATPEQLAAFNAKTKK
jgi:uncharacterized protein